MDLAEIMATSFAVVSPEASLADVSRRMIDVDTGAAAVVDDDELVGMISERDLLRVFRDGGSPDQPVAERMAHPEQVAGRQREFSGGRATGEGGGPHRAQKVPAASQTFAATG